MNLKIIVSMMLSNHFLNALKWNALCLRKTDI